VQFSVFSVFAMLDKSSKIKDNTSRFTMELWTACINYLDYYLFFCYDYKRLCCFCLCNISQLYTFVTCCYI